MTESHIIKSIIKTEVCLVNIYFKIDDMKYLQRGLSRSINILIRRKKDGT